MELGNEEKAFQRYVNPPEFIAPKVSEVTSLTVDNGFLYYRGKKVETVSLERALEEFIGYLKEFNGPCILVGHNIFSFDTKVLYNALSTVNLFEEFSKTTKGFLDTLAIARKQFPKRPGGYSQSVLVEDFLNMKYDAHNALEDSKTLAKLCTVFNLDSLELATPNDLKAPEIVKLFQPLINKKALSQAMASKIVKSGLTLDHVKRMYESEGVDGLHALLSEKTKDGPRVSKQYKVALKISQYFDKLK